MTNSSENPKIDKLVSDVADLKASQRYLVQSIDEMKRTAYVNKADYVEDIGILREDIRSLKDQTRNTPTVERVVFGLAGLILTAVIIAVVALVVNRGSA